MWKTLLLALALGFASCSHEQPPPQSGAPQTVGSVPVTAGTAGVGPGEPAAREEGSQSAPLPAPNAWHGDLLRDSLDLPSLTAAQREQIQALLQQEQSANVTVRAAREQLVEAVADAIDSGNVNGVALAPKVNALVNAIQAAEPTDRSLIESLHTILSPEQRTALANELEEQLRAARTRMSEPSNMRAMWLGTADPTPAQQSQIETNFRAFYASLDPSERTSMLDDHLRVLEAFKGGSFVMSQVASIKSRDDIERHVSYLVNMASAATPVLTSEQRAAAASKLRSWAAKPEK